MSAFGQRYTEGDGQISADRRSGERRRVLKGATVSFNSGYSSFECVVRSESDRGARLSFGETFALPNRFTLRTAGERPRAAEVRWRNATQVGIEFV